MSEVSNTEFTGPLGETNKESRHIFIMMAFAVILGLSATTAFLIMLPKWTSLVLQWAFITGGLTFLAVTTALIAVWAAKHEIWQW